MQKRKLNRVSVGCEVILARGGVKKGCGAAAATADADDTHTHPLLFSSPLASYMPCNGRVGRCRYIHALTKGGWMGGSVEDCELLW